MDTTRRGQGRVQRVAMSVQHNATIEGRNSTRCEQRRSGLPLWTAAIFAVTALAMFLPAKNSQSANPTAAVKVHEITWIHPSPAGVRSFVVLVSPVSGSLAQARQIDVGKPNGIDIGFGQQFSALVPIAIDEFVSVRALGLNGLPSALSEWRQPQPSQPGQPLVVEP